MLFPATTLWVKMCLERSAERDKYENKISAEYIRSYLLYLISQPFASSKTDSLRKDLTYPLVKAVLAGGRNGETWVFRVI